MPTEVSLEQFRVMMGVFHDAIEVVDVQSKRVATVLGEVSGTFSAVEQNWQSPAEPTLRDLAAEYRTDATNLNDLLEEILRRMRQSYQNYREVELRAERNLREQEVSARSHLRLQAADPGAAADSPPRAELRLDAPAAGAGPQPDSTDMSTARPADTGSTPQSELIDMLGQKIGEIDGKSQMPPAQHAG